MPLPQRPNSHRPNVGFLLTVGPQDPRFALCLEAVERMRQEGREIFFYCLDEGVLATEDARLLDYLVYPELGPRFHLLGCAYAAERRKRPYRAEVTYGGLQMLGDLIAHTDLFYSF